MPSKQGIHVVANAIAEVVAYDAYAIQPGDEGIVIERWELTNDLQSLVEHSDQCIEVAVILIPDIVAVSCSAFAVEHHQFRESGRPHCWNSRPLGYVLNRQF